MEAIEARHAKAKKPTPANKKARRTPIKTRRALGFFFQVVSEFLFELGFIHSPFTISGD